jgi:hypothetical protein
VAIKAWWGDAGGPGRDDEPWWPPAAGPGHKWMDPVHGL